ncbi:hypothetical protein GIW32_11745 [Pseudomonas syringae]|nr:hypothetical protein [Pseudomonas syringae]MCF5243836.1 hypothetical protein [Pseudomonas syringae]
MPAHVLQCLVQTAWLDTDTTCNALKRASRVATVGPLT